MSERKMDENLKLNSPAPAVSHDMAYSDETKIRIFTDGTSTVAEVVQIDHTFGDLVRGRGVARRRKGDKRREGIGTSLAVGRALRDAAQRIEEALSQEGYTL